MLQENSVGDLRSGNQIALQPRPDHVGEYFSSKVYIVIGIDAKWPRKVKWENRSGMWLWNGRFGNGGYKNKAPYLEKQLICG